MPIIGHGNDKFGEKTMIKIVKQDYDDHGNEIYREWSDGVWVKWEYKDKGKLTYYESSKGYWERCEYDENCNETYYENSNGVKRGTKSSKYILDGKEYTADELRIGYRIITGLNNDTEFTDNEIYSYLLEEFEKDSDTNDKNNSSNNVDLIDRTILLRYIDAMRIKDCINNTVIEAANTMQSLFKQVVEAMPRAERDDNNA